MYMEIVRSNELFEITETTDRYIVEGVINCDRNGNLNIDLRFSNLDTTGLGNSSYTTHPEINGVSFSVSCSEKNRIELIEYTEEVIALIFNHFKGNN